MAKPSSSDYPEYFGKYIAQVPDEDIVAGFKNQQHILESFLSEIDEHDSTFSYAPGKWTIKELVQHCIDAERVFGYRALCFARKDKTSLPSFDENTYAISSGANTRTWNTIQNEFINLRRSTRDLFESFSPEMLAEKGIANNKEMSVLSLGFIILGHVYHHMTVAKEKYLSK